VTRALAVVATPRAEGAAAAEFLRVVAALRAVGAEVDLVETGPGVGALAAARAAGTDDEVVRLLEALAEDGVSPARDADLARAVAAATALLVLSAPQRAGTPPVLRLRRGDAPSAEGLAALAAAGQVVLA
jgi:hypothetical protein